MSMGWEQAKKSHHELATVLAWLARTPEAEWPPDVSETFKHAARDLRDGKPSEQVLHGPLEPGGPGPG